MKTLYLECNMGAAGDMLMSALSELIPNPVAFIERMNGLGIPGVRLERQTAEKLGITGTHIAVTVDGEEELSHDDHDHDHEHEHHHDHDHDHEHEHHHDHEHGHDHHDHEHHHDHDHDHDHHDHDHDHHHHHHHHALGDIAALIDGLDLPEKVKADARQVYDLVARAEAKAHGTPVEQVHFHEVGALDAVADVVGVCLLMDMIKPDRVEVSPVHVGFGQVRCAHGILPVPAPATASILEGVPIYGGRVRGELCTPTGAALLKHFADGFGPMPVMTLEKTGIGMGTKDFEWANCLRAMLGTTRESGDEVSELMCNLDDMTGEEIGYACEALREAGALDVYTQAIQMKKNRPGVLLSCLCPADREGEFARLMLRLTTTIGVRCRRMNRYTLQREPLTLDTAYGPVRAKRSHGYGVDRVKMEFDDVRDIARREGISPREVR